MLDNEIKKSYWSVVPADVRYSKKLQPAAKLLYGEISALCNERGYCWASNDYFAQLYETTTRTVQRWLASLEKGGFVNVKVKGTDRKIYLAQKFGDAPEAPAEPKPGKKKKEREFNALGAEIIKAFEQVDPKNKRYYGNTTQREACDFLIEEYGLDDTLKRVSVLTKTNKTPHFPVITTPAQLRDKWVQLQDAVDRKRAEFGAKKPTAKVAFT